MRAYYDSLNAYWNDNNKQSHAFIITIRQVWNKTAVAGWVQNIANAKTALSTALANGTISQDRYNVLLERVKVEEVAVMYMNILSGGNTSAAYKQEFRNLLDYFGYTTSGVLTIDELFKHVIK